MPFIGCTYQLHVELCAITSHCHLAQIYKLESGGGHLTTGHLEVSDNLGDVGLHLVHLLKVGVLALQPATASAMF